MMRTGGLKLASQCNQSVYEFKYVSYLVISVLLCGIIFLLDFVSNNSFIRQSRMLFALSDNGCHALCSLLQYVLFQYIIFIQRRYNDNIKDDSNESTSDIDYCSNNSSTGNENNCSGHNCSGNPLGLHHSISKVIASISPKEALFSLFSGSIVDIDHFLAAGSFSLGAATSLPTRPLGHCVGFALPILFMIYTIASKVVCRNKIEESVKYQLFIGYVSHIFRDSTKRGVWIWFGISSYPLSTPIYTIMFACAPAIFYLILCVEGKGDLIGVSRFLDKTKQSVINALDNV